MVFLLPIDFFYAFTDGCYRFLYEEIDESDVEILYFVSQSSEDQGVEEFRFPRAGII